MLNMRKTYKIFLLVAIASLSVLIAVAQESINEIAFLSEELSSINRFHEALGKIKTIDDAFEREEFIATLFPDGKNPTLLPEAKLMYQWTSSDGQREGDYAQRVKDYFNQYYGYFSLASDGSPKSALVTVLSPVSEADSVYKGSAYLKVGYNGRAEGLNESSKFLRYDFVSSVDGDKFRVLLERIEIVAPYSVTLPADALSSREISSFIQGELEVFDDASTNRSVKRQLSQVSLKCANYFSKEIEKLIDRVIQSNNTDNELMLNDLRDALSLVRYVAAAAPQKARDYKSQINRLQHEIQMATEAERQAKLSEFELLLDDAKKLASYSEYDEALRKLSNALRIEKSKEVIDLKNEYTLRSDELSKLKDRIEEDARYKKKTLADSLSRFAIEPEFASDYLLAHFYLELAVSEEEQRDFRLRKAKEYCDACVSKFPNITKCREARIELNTFTLSAMRSNGNDQYLAITRELKDDYIVLARLSGDGLRFAKEGGDYFKSAEDKESVVDILKTAWSNYKGRDNEHMQLGFALTDEYLELKRNSFAKRILTELGEWYPSAREDHEYWVLLMQVLVATPSSELESTLTEFSANFPPETVSRVLGSVAENYKEKGRRYKLSEEYVKALKEYRAATRIDDLDYDVWMDRAELELKTEHYDMVEYCLDQAERISITNQTRMLRARMQLARGDVPSDLEKLASIANREGASLSDMTTFITALHAHDQEKRAKRYLKTEIKPIGKNSSIYRLCKYYDEKGFNDPKRDLKALKYLEKHAKISYKGRDFFELACAYLNWNPYAELRFDLASLESDQKSRAMGYFKDALSLDFSPWMCYRYMANFEMQKKNYKNAAELFEENVKLKPDDIDARLKLGVCYFYQDDYLLSAQAFTSARDYDLDGHMHESDAVSQTILSIAGLSFCGRDYLNAEPESVTHTSTDTWMFLNEQHDYVMQTFPYKLFKLTKQQLGYDEAKREIRELERSNLNSPPHFMDIEAFEETELFKELRKNADIRMVWKQLKKSE